MPRSARAGLRALLARWRPPLDSEDDPAGMRNYGCAFSAQPLCVFEKYEGSAGRAQLQPEELTGVLSPVRDAIFFGQVFNDCGAVAWLGDSELAPDAINAEADTRQNG